ncbi:PREDICTED: transmembrane protein 134 isoform X1 [Condylura cristata]|uniref:transmembrane protein 134 isoform X1 n=1 Tax=Condylura cristata TaxID=143302 RepID=UPI0006436B93|nr:PREDICTED: transmembrane protein 134 isoform X1 [Condylura cristata]
MSAARPQFCIDDAFELSLEDAGPGPETSGVARFGPLHFERRARFEVTEEEKQSRLRYQNLENDEDGAQASPEPDGGVSTRDSRGSSIRSSQWSFSTISNGTQRSYRACCSWTQHPLIQKNLRIVLASFLLLLLGLVLILVGVGLEVAPSPVCSCLCGHVSGKYSASISLSMDGHVPMACVSRLGDDIHLPSHFPLSLSAPTASQAACRSWILS